MSKITVKNSPAPAFDIRVAINEWGSGGKTEFFTIKPGGHETWDRSDGRGFIMALDANGATIPYWVKAGDTLNVDLQGRVFLGENKVLTPLCWMRT